jgi:glucokinase
MYLAGDLGGTKTLLAEFEPAGDSLREVRQRQFPSRSYPAFDMILTEFLAERTGPPLRSACFGVAGAVVGGRSQATNLPWALDEPSLARVIGVSRVKLLNDLEATAYGMLALPASSLSVLNASTSSGPGRSGNVGVIAAGTGLGEAMLYWDGERHHPVASEGGHADFAPRNLHEVELWTYLQRTFGGHVSYERVLSGPGLRNVYNFLREADPSAEPDWLVEEMNAGDPAAVISAHGLKGDVPICVEAMAMFVSAYGAEAGNVALRSVATGGVFLGGGIAPKILPALRSPSFLESFTAKGRFAPFLKTIEISVSLDPHAALLGAAHYATRL